MRNSVPTDVRRPRARTASARARVAGTTGEKTRESIVTTAERLFAEQGMAVSNRQISEAAGQANNSAVAYHFETKTDLVLAIVRRHATSIEQRRAAMLETMNPSADLRDWLFCIVRPITDHLESLGTPAWYAEFTAQATTDPALRLAVFDETVASPAMLATFEGLTRLLPVLPAEIHAERGDMMRQLIVHVCAERERALRARSPTPRATWDDAAIGLVDALVGLWRAPFTTAGTPRAAKTTTDDSAPSARARSRGTKGRS